MGSRRLVVRCIDDRQAVARGHVAFGIIGEGRVDRSARDGGHPMQQRLAGGGIAVGPHVRLGCEVADEIVGEALVERRGREIDGSRGHPIEANMGPLISTCRPASPFMETTQPFSNFSSSCSPTSG